MKLWPTRPIEWVIAALVGAAACPIALAQAPPPDPGRTADQVEAERVERQRQFESLGDDIRLGEDQIRRLQAEIEAIRRDREEINRQLVETARTVQRAEADVTAGEARLRGLASEERQLRQALAERRAVISELLAALQRLGRNPPPALVVEPESVLRAIRSAILLGAVLPELRGEADKVVADLERFAALRRTVESEVERQRAHLTTLSENRARLQLLVEEKRRSQSLSEAELARTRSRAEQLARDARSLRDLITRMEQEIASARRAADEAARAEAQRQEAARQAEEQRQLDAVRREAQPERRTVAAVPNAARLAPAIAFDRTQGLLPLPASGEAVRSFGDDDGMGGTHRGLSIGTRAGATVTAPADGWVVYAGPFRAYGQLVIVNVGGGYHILLAGMERITVEAGQFVLAGEPVAQMGARMLATATSIDVGADRPVLYVEFRKDGVPIDPGPWWAETAEKARG
jgi:septal ring factor EnvC (AmiA/AmiB activator)